MTLTRQLHLELDPELSRIHRIIEKIKEFLPDLEKNVQEATLMTSSELIENAILYRHPEELSIVFDLHIDDTQIVISVANNTNSEKNLKNIQKAITTINSQQNTTNLYVHRFLEIFRNPLTWEKSLGLFRIVHEGKFKLSYRIQGSQKVTMLAKRNITYNQTIKKKAPNI